MPEEIGDLGGELGGGEPGGGSSGGGSGSSGNDLGSPTGTCQTYQSDSFTDTTGVLLKNHNGELNTDWQKPFTGANPAYQRINSAGRTEYVFENEGGFTQNGSEHFTTNYTFPTADYSLQVDIYVGDYVYHTGTFPTGPESPPESDAAEIYIRAQIPYEFYALSYSRSTRQWLLKVQLDAFTSTTLASWTQPEDIPYGGYVRARLEAEGNILRVYLDGVLRMTATDSQITGPGYIGIRLGLFGSGNVTASSLQFDNIIATSCFLDTSTSSPPNNEVVQATSNLRNFYPNRLHSFPPNHRFQGIRESAKFNYPINALIFNYEKLSAEVSTQSSNLENSYNFGLSDTYLERFITAQEKLNYHMYKESLNKIGRWY